MHAVGGLDCSIRCAPGLRMRDLRRGRNFGLVIACSAEPLGDLAFVGARCHRHAPGAPTTMPVPRWRRPGRAGRLVDMSRARRDWHFDQTRCPYRRFIAAALSRRVRRHRDGRRAGFKSGQVTLVPWPGSVVLWPRRGVCGSVNAIATAGGQTKMTDPQYLPWYMYGALILAAAVAVSGLFGNVWVFALALLGFVLMMMLMLHIMDGGGPSGVRANSSRSSQQATDQGSGT